MDLSHITEPLKLSIPTSYSDQSYIYKNKFDNELFIAHCNETKKELPLKILLRTVEWSRNRCCWPKGDPKLPGFSFCGTVIVPGRPYCEEHSNLAYTNTRES